MTEANIQDQSHEFILAAEGQWVDIEAGDSSSGNKKAKLVDKIVNQWGRAGVAAERLQQLLNHASPSVRLAAASHLINFGGADLATPVLKELSKSPVGLISSFADTVLRVRKLAD